MAQMHGKRFFIGVENVKGLFFIDKAPVWEIEHPFRVADPAYFFHVWPGKALVAGWWKQSTDLEKHLLEAMGGRIVNEPEKTQVQ